MKPYGHAEDDLPLSMGNSWVIVFNTWLRRSISMRRGRIGSIERVSRIGCTVASDWKSLPRRPERRGNSIFMGIVAPLVRDKPQCVSVRYHSRFKVGKHFDPVDKQAFSG